MWLYSKCVWPMGAGSLRPSWKSWAWKAGAYSFRNCSGMNPGRPKPLPDVALYPNSFPPVPIFRNGLASTCSTSVLYWRGKTVPEDTHERTPFCRECRDLAASPPRCGEIMIAIFVGSEEWREGKEGVRTWRARGSKGHKKKKIK